MTSSQFVTTGREFHPEPSTLRNQGAFVRRGNILPPFHYGPSRNVTCLDSFFASAPTRRTPTFQGHVAAHNLPLGVDSNCVHVESLGALEARFDFVPGSFYILEKPRPTKRSDLFPRAQATHATPMGTQFALTSLPLVVTARGVRVCPCALAHVSAISHDVLCT